MSSIKFTILGEPASKANSRDIVKIAGRPASIKSEKARDFEANALRQIPPAARVRIACPVRVTLHIFYASERPDLDESVVLDVLQDRHKSIKLTRADRELGVKPQRLLIQKGVYVNDRLVREKHVYHGIDKKNPRVEVMVEPIDGRQGELLGVSA
jgi:Holliday junction resolvase RusA-like endonuclease